MIHKIKYGFFVIVLVLLVLEITSRYVVQSELLMYQIFNNTTDMWLSLWQNKPSNQAELYSPIYSWDERLGWTLDSSLDHYQLSDDVYYSTVNDGIRSNNNTTLQKDSSKYRIAVIGDSYTEGAEVSNDFTWANFLELNDTTQLEVLNFGVGGYGHDQCLIRLEKDVLKYKPDVVVLGFVNCDVERNTVAFRDFAKPRFIIDGDKLTLADSIIKPVSAYKKKWPFKSIALASLAANNEEWKNWKYQEDLTEMIVTEMHTKCEENGVTFILAFIPTPNELLGDFPKNNISQFAQAICAKNNIIYFNTTSIFEEELKKGKELKKEGHWDKRGNELIGNQIFQMLKLN